MPVKVSTVVSSPIAAPLTTSIPGLTSVRNIFGTAPARRHTVGQMPSTHFSPRLPITSGGNHHRSQPSVSSLFTGGVVGIGSAGGGAPKKTAAEKAAERDWDEQAKQIFQLSTVSAKGHFLPPSPSPLEYTIQAGGGGVGGLMSSSHDRFKDSDADYFTTIIISTSPEKVRTFLSTESSISPGMFSSPANKIKRNAIPSFSTPPSSSCSTVSSSLSSSPSEPSSTRSSTPTLMSQQQQQLQRPVATVQGEKNSNVTVAIPTNPPSLPSISSVAVPSVAAIPAAIPKRRIVAPADTLSTPPSSPPAISTKDMYFPAEATEKSTPSPTTPYIPVPVTSTNNTPRTAPITPGTPQSSFSNSSSTYSNSFSQRQRHRRPHQESPMHKNSRVAEEEEEEDEHNAGGRDSSRTMLNKRREQISFLTGVTPEEEEDLSDIFAHTVYNSSSNNSRSKRNNSLLSSSSSSLLSSSPPDLLFGHSSHNISDKNALSSLLDAAPRRMSSSSSPRASAHQHDRERTRQISTHKTIAQNAF
ncbi:hypothetical protein BGZ95_000881 [Linnemannia exigua]|uniref:Uncharacterized protein n=1 Tax=Linnemannia exigua TaxID=604196 RepID=A0AAD4H416_9FUNG|nr:hypothetical protein BGZ95_000881 [Linnemannia exigua]